MGANFVLQESDIVSFSPFVPAFERDRVLEALAANVPRSARPALMPEPQATRSWFYEPYTLQHWVSARVPRPAAPSPPPLAAPPRPPSDVPSPPVAIFHGSDSCADTLQGCTRALCGMLGRTLTRPTSTAIALPPPLPQVLYRPLAHGKTYMPAGQL